MSHSQTFTLTVKGLDLTAALIGKHKNFNRYLALSLFALTVWWSGSLPWHFRRQCVHIRCQYSQSQAEIPTLQRKQEGSDNVSHLHSWSLALSPSLFLCLRALHYCMAHDLFGSSGVRTPKASATLIGAVHAQLCFRMWCDSQHTLTVKINWKQWSRIEKKKN